DTDFTLLDGKAGHDTLTWRGEADLNLSTIADKVKNIEVIDLRINGTATTLTLTERDIEKITDDKNALYIRGGSNDALSLQGMWNVIGTETLNNIVYTLYTHTTSEGKVIKLYVQAGLTFNEMPEFISGVITAEEVQTVSVESVSQHGETVHLSEGEVSFKGAWGTLFINETGEYTYVADEAFAHSGNRDVFTYTLSDGSKATLSIELGIDIDGSNGGELTFTGTGGNDVFQVYDTDFISINGAEGGDTLAWHGSETLNLSLISSKVYNIESIDLLDNGNNDHLLISAESLLKVTDDNNTLYVRGADGDTVMLNGKWESSGDLLVNGVNYKHYTSSTMDGSVVQLYVEDDVAIG
ncbi:Ig-like domain-containing protein, partial [Erwinia oleae]|uniref:Ig-like domain-containing protein n=1 Tax=Erwinia oleae TaxID=796334 RepID=UPI000551878D